MTGQAPGPIPGGPLGNQYPRTEAHRLPGDTGTARSVCLYTPSANPSGMGSHMLALGRELAVLGHDVTLMYWPTPAARQLLSRAREYGARLVETPHPRDPLFAPVITGHLRQRPTDVFHVHVGTGRENFDGARAARAAGVPAVVQTLHLPWLLRSKHKRTGFFDSLPAVDALIAVSEAQKATYRRIGVPEELMTTVPNGVPPRGPGPGRLEARRRLGLDPDRRVVMSVGRLVVMKGQRHLVDALPALTGRVPDVAVVLVGDGHLRETLAGQAAALGVGDTLRLVGHRADARDLLDAADVFVLPSLHEGMPMAALEAMDAGLPVVGTRVIGTSEAVADRRTGRLVPAGDAEALGAALGEVLEDPALRAQYGAAGRRLYRAEFTAARMTTRTRAVYERVLAARSTPAPSTGGG